MDGSSFEVGYVFQTSFSNGFNKFDSSALGAMASLGQEYFVANDSGSTAITYGEGQASTTFSITKNAGGTWSSYPAGASGLPNAYTYPLILSANNVFLLASRNFPTLTLNDLWYSLSGSVNSWVKIPTPWSGSTGYIQPGLLTNFNYLNGWWIIQNPVGAVSNYSASVGPSNWSSSTVWKPNLFPSTVYIDYSSSGTYFGFNNGGTASGSNYIYVSTDPTKGWQHVPIPNTFASVNFSTKTPLVSKGWVNNNGQVTVLFGSPSANMSIGNFDAYAITSSSISGSTIIWGTATYLGYMRSLSGGIGSAWKDVSGKWGVEMGYQAAPGATSTIDGINFVSVTTGVDSFTLTGGVSNTSGPRLYKSGRLI
jgi:hypothetical protein